MREARVKCICAQIGLPDLKVTLTAGQEIWLSEEQVRLSADLQHARRISAVDLVWKERARVSKPPSHLAPPHFRRLSPGQHKKIERQEQPAPVIVHSIDPDLLTKHVKAAVAGEVSKQMMDVKAQMAALEDHLATQIAEALAEKGQQIDSEALSAALDQALKGLLSTVPQAAPGAPKVEDKEPLYIPSGIVEPKAKGVVDVQESTGTGDDLDDAAKALKKKRKQGK